MSRKRKAVIAALSLVAVLFLLPWTAIISARLITLLEAQGLRNVRLQVKGITFSSLALSDLSFGEETPLTLKKVTLDYSLRDLWQGHINNITLSNLTLAIQKVKGSWGITGFEHMGGTEEIFIPVTADTIVLTSATLEDSQIQLRAPGMQGSIPLHLTWQRTPEPVIEYRGKGLTFTASGITATTGDTTLHLALDETGKTWNGKWASKAITFTGLPVAVPASECSGIVIAKEKYVSTTGLCDDASKNFRAAFSFDYPLADPQRAALTLQSLSLPWNSGIISLKNIVIPLSNMTAYTLPITVTSVSLNALLQPLTGNRATATGSISGKIAIIVKSDGSYDFGQSSLTAEQPGIISMAPDAIPGDNAQIVLLREMLSDFHYNLLSLTVGNEKNQTLAVTLALQGNNPAVYNGRPVKLNVHLGGDVLDFITQSMAVNDPRTFLKKSIHAP